MKTNSLRAQMLTLSVSTVLITALTILSAFWWTTSNYTQQQVRVHIDSALKVFNQFLESRQQQLFISAEVLTSDFGFKQAVASRDNATITSALLNHGQRINADLMLLIDLEGDIVASSDETGAPGTPFNHPLLIQKTLDAGGATSFVQLGDTVFQIILLPVKAPLTIAIAGIGFRLDLSVVQHLRNLSGLNVTLISTGQGIPVTISTLAPETQPSALKSPSEVARAALLPFHQQQHFSSHKLNLESHNDSSVDVVLTEHLDEAYADFNRLGWNILTISGVTIILAILGSLLFSRGMTRPLNTLVALAEKFAKGQYIKVHTPSSVTREIGTLMNAFSKMGSEIEKREQHITYQAMHDPLTGLLNRATMLERINLLTNETGAPFVLIACNIVGFRIINDNFGPTTGDFCLRAVAQRMTHFGEKHPLLAARVSGDEFLIAISHHAEYSEQLSHALMEHLSSPMTYGEIIFTLNFRFGISRFPDDGNNASVLSRRTSIALDAARKEQVSLRHYKEGEDDAHLLRLKTISNLKQALNSDDGQLFMFYQPKKNLVTGRIEKLEALIRWIHPQEGFIAPDYFVELAEQSGQIDQLTDWVISQVLKQLAQWQQSGLSIQVAINISAHDLERESLLNNVTHQLSDLGLPHHSVSFELTERDMMQNADLAIELMGRFKKQGFSLSVDDYGIGYSSLSKLKQMPVNELKIDKSFVLQLDQSESDQIIVQSTIDLAHSFNLKVIAEGVENQATQEVLKSMGCDYIQGYYLAKPMAAADVAQWISNHEKASRPYLPKPPFSPLILGLNLVLTAHPCLAGSGKLLGTPGTTQLEGSAGGGLVPWAGLAGYATSDEVAVSAFATQVNLDDFRLDVWGAAANLYDRIEVSVAQQRFYVQPLKSEIEQAIFGLKTRVAGDLVFDELPQISLGTQLKHLQDKQIARSVGAKSVSTGADVYLTASKLHLAAAWGYNVLWNITVRGTRANQLGLLGYGGDTNNNYRLEAELSSALLITPQWALGVEYRQKPNNLSALKETDWKDVFLAYFPNKHLNMTIAWADLGEIAGQSSQQGTYISITGYLW